MAKIPKASCNCMRSFALGSSHSHRIHWRLDALRQPSKISELWWVYLLPLFLCSSTCTALDSPINPGDCMHQMIAITNHGLDL